MKPNDLAVVCVTILALSAAGYSPGAAVARQPQAKPEAIDVMKADFPALVDALTDEHQSQAGKAPGAVNGYGLLVEAYAKWRGVMDEAKKAAGDSADAPMLDFTVLYDREYRPIRNGMKKEDIERVTRGAIARAKALGVDDLLDRAAAAPRMARAKFGSPERAAEQKAAGTDGSFDGKMVSVLLPELGGFRFLARYGAARMSEAARDGDGAEFARAFEHALAVGRAASHQPTMIDRLVGLAIQELAFTRAMDEMRRFKPAEAELERMRTALERQTGTLPGAALAIEGERLLALDACRWVFNADGRMDVRALRELGALSSEKAQGIAFLGSTREGNVMGVEAVLDEARKWLNTPRRERAGSFDSAAFDRQREMNPDFVVARMMVPALDKYESSLSLSAVLREGFGVALAVERFERARGAYPASLDEVVAAGLLEAIPEDAVTGQPMRYVRLTKPDEFGRAYLIYSVGADGEDNGGREAEDRDVRVNHALFKAKEGAGFDFVINGR
jgi:hypothetical protein